MSTDTIDDVTQGLIADLARDPGVQLASRLPRYTGIENLPAEEAQRLSVIDQDPRFCSYGWNTRLKIALVDGYQPQDSLVLCCTCDGHGVNPKGKKCEGYMRRDKYSGKKPAK